MEVIRKEYSVVLCDNYNVISINFVAQSSAKLHMQVAGRSLIMQSMLDAAL